MNDLFWNGTVDISTAKINNLPLVKVERTETYGGLCYVSSDFFI